MPERVRDSWFALCGIGFVVIGIVGVDLVGNLPDELDDAAVVDSFYADSANRVPVIVGAYVLGAAGLLLLAFVAGLTQQVRGVTGDRSSLPTMLLISGATYAALLLVGASLRVSVSFGVSVGQLYPGADVARSLPHIGWIVMRLHGLIAAIPFVLIPSVVALRKGIYPAWIGWLGVVVAVLLPLGATVFPLSVLPIWVLAVGGYHLATGRPPGIYPVGAAVRNSSPGAG